MTFEITELRAGMERDVAGFFEAIRPDEDLFHPHPLTENEAARICNHGGRDIYVGMFRNGQMIGYGMLRGWDKGYEVPAIGLALHPDARGEGLSTGFMEFLMLAARKRGSSRVRGRLLKTNLTSRRMCERVGFTFTVDDGDYLIGFADV